MDPIAAHAASRPGDIAAICGDRRLTYGEFGRLVGGAARGLRSVGLEPGERAVILAGNSIDFLVAWAAVRRTGGVAVPVNRHLAPAEIAWVLEDCSPRLVFTDPGHVEMVAGAAAGGVSIVVAAQAPDVPRAIAFASLLGDASSADPEGIEGAGSYMLYTSGTTGKPKAAVHTSPPDVQMGATYAEAFGLSSEDVHLVAGPLYHSAPAAFCALTLALGGTVVVMPKFDPTQALELIQREAVTTTFMAPTLVHRILMLGAEQISTYDTSSLRALIVAGAPFPFHLKRGAQEAFGEVLYEFYGSTETKAALYIGPADQMRKPGSCGVPFPGVEVRLVAEDGSEPSQGAPGEIWVRRNRSTFDGYLGDPEKTAETIRGDWIATGDVAYRDPDGYHYICDRLSDMVITGGVNVYPAEIEGVLLEHPAVADAVVFGVPDEEWGERLHGVVQTRAADVGFDALEQFLEGRLASFKVPRSWERVKELPRGDDGKVVKRALRSALMKRRVGS